VLLSLIGVPTDRAQALALFNLARSNRGFSGARLDEIGQAVECGARLGEWRWQIMDRLTFGAVCRSIRSQLSSNRREPTLLSFGIIHKNGIWRCTHVAVVTGLRNKTIELLDPLGSKPSGQENRNVLLVQDQTASGGIRVFGATYRVDCEAEVAILRWR
jgi:hypothetical protein